MSLQFAIADAASRQAAEPSNLDPDEASLDDDCPPLAARGIITAMALSVPIWLMIGVAAYKLI